MPDGSRTDGSRKEAANGSRPDGSRLSGLIIDDRESGIFRVHRSAFVSDEIFALERSLIFDKSWLFAGHVTEFPRPGDFVTRTVARTSTHSRARR